MIKRLAAASGSVMGDPVGESGSETLTKKAVLVHAGADGDQISFGSQDGEVIFDPIRIQNIVHANNKRLETLWQQYGGHDKMPVGAYPPILDQHESDSNNRIVGRMTKPFRYEVMDLPKVGKQVPCVVTEITFIGSENVKRVHDGRIYHLSVGISDSSDLLDEVSTVIEPAAPGAMLLSKPPPPAERIKQPKGDKKMPLKKLQKLKDNRAKRLAKLQEMDGELKKLSGNLTSAKDTVRLTKRQGEVTHRLTGLMKGGKLTPAEFKKLDVKKLSALADEALDTVLSTFEARENVIAPGQQGTRDAVPFASLTDGMKKKDITRLGKETAADFKRMSGGKIQFKSDKFGEDSDELAGGNKEIPAHPGKDKGAVEDEGGDQEAQQKLAHHLSEMGKHLEAGDLEKSKLAYAECQKHMSGAKHLALGDAGSEDYKTAMSTLEARVDEVSTQMARLSGAVTEMMKSEEEEGQDLAEEDAPQETVHEEEGDKIDKEKDQPTA